jgi:hypothetical protein
MNEMAAFALFTVPLLSFIAAGMLEFQRDRGSLRSLTRMLLLAVAVVVSIVLLNVSPPPVKNDVGLVAFDRGVRACLPI